MKYKVEDLVVDMAKHIITRAGVEIELSKREKQLLIVLLEGKGEVVSREVIMEAFGLEYNDHTNIPDVFVSYLRRKIDDNHEFKIIRTIRDYGYAIRM